MKGKLLIGSTLLILVCMGSLAYYGYVYRGEMIRKQHTRIIDGYVLRTYPSFVSPGFCGNDEISTTDGKSIFTVQLCEDRIESISRNGDWIYASTSARRSLRVNIKTGEKEILHNHRGVGSMKFK